MKKVYLIRHAKSSWKFADLTDFDRPLNDRGNRDAPFMGKVLKDQNAKPDLIYSSTAVRAITTAKIIANVVGYDVSNIVETEDIYEASAGEILDIIQSTDDKHNTIFVFGHNPGMTSLSNYMCDRIIDNLPTCGISIIEFPADKWEDVTLRSGKLVGFEYPKKYPIND